MRKRGQPFYRARKISTDFSPCGIANEKKGIVHSAIMSLLYLKNMYRVIILTTIYEQTIQRAFTGSYF